MLSSQKLLLGPAISLECRRSRQHQRNVGQRSIYCTLCVVNLVDILYEMFS